MQLLFYVFDVISLDTCSWCLLLNSFLGILQKKYYSYEFIKRSKRAKFIKMQIKQDCENIIFRKNRGLAPDVTSLYSLFSKMFKSRTLLKKDKAFIMIVILISSQYLVWFLRKSIKKETFFCNISNSAIST